MRTYVKLIPTASLAAATAAAFTVALLATHAASESTASTASRPSASAARTSFPGLVAATGDPRLPSLEAARPAAGTAVQAPGPFDDRFTMSGLAFNGTTVTATVRITSDVSDILELEALAGFYDGDGHLLGTVPATRHQTEAETAHNHVGPPSETEQLSIAVPAALHGKVVSAAVGVPVLVNE